MCRGNAIKKKKNRSSHGYARYPVPQKTSEAELEADLTTVSERGRGSCVFLVEERSHLMPVDTPAALAPLCGTLCCAFVDTASHTS